MDPLTLRHNEHLVGEILQRAVCGHLTPDAGYDLFAVEARGCELEAGPFSSLVDVDEAQAHDVIADLLQAALASGATRVALQVERSER